MKLPHPSHNRSGPGWGRHLLWLALGLVGCDKAVETTPQAPPKRFVYVAPPPVVATHVPDGMGQWLGLLQDLQEQISALEERFQEASALHRETAFEDLLKVDLNTLDNDQLAYLWHFADKGYFTLEREIMVKLLTDQANRAPATISAPSNIAERAQVLAERYEGHLKDLQLAVEMYGKTKEVEFAIPNQLNAEQTDILQDMVAEKLAQARQECITLDLRIEQLQGRTKADEDTSQSVR
jgi:DNA-binding protein YbaB